MGTEYRARKINTATNTRIQTIGSGRDLGGKDSANAFMLLLSSEFLVVSLFNYFELYNLHYICSGLLIETNDYLMSTKPENEKVFKIEKSQVVPTSFNAVTESEWEERGVNIVCYANHMLRSSYPAMEIVALSILENKRAYEADEFCLSVKEILNLIPGTN